jgi:hypothetical protein
MESEESMEIEEEWGTMESEEWFESEKDEEPLENRWMKAKMKNGVKCLGVFTFYFLKGL